jgi:hypothetical protein
MLLEMLQTGNNDCHHNTFHKYTKGICNCNYTMRIFIFKWFSYLTYFPVLMGFNVLEGKFRQFDDSHRFRQAFLTPICRLLKSYTYYYHA